MIILRKIMKHGTKRFIGKEQFGPNIQYEDMERLEKKM